MVTFHPDLDALTACVLGPVSAGVKVIVFDNTDSVELAMAVKEALSRLNVEYWTELENIGLGAAHNRVAREAFSRGTEYLLLLDQDSAITEEAIARLVECAEELRRRRVPLAAIGPQTSIPSGCQAPPEEVETIITSGSLIPHAAWQRVGELREDLFIDHVDHEWCYRARKLGLALYMAPGVYMHHRLGSRSLGLWPLKRRLIVHDLKRYYFRTRNLLALTLEGAVPFRFAVSAGAKLTVTVVVAGLIHRRPVKALRLALRGMWDGWYRQMGRPAWF